MMSYFWNILASLDGLETLGLLTLAAVKATLLVAFAALLCLAFRRLSAATRHLLWASALCASLLLPFLSFIKMWEVPVFSARTVPDVSDSKELNANDEVFGKLLARRTQDLSGSSEASDSVRKGSEFQTHQEFLKEPPAAQSTFQNTFEPQPQPQETATSLLPQVVNWILVVWSAVMLLLLLRLLIGLTVTKLLARRAVEFKDPALIRLFSSLLAEVNLKSTVRLLRSERTLMPIVCGILRPVVLLPADAEKWSEEQQRMVLLPAGCASNASEPVTITC
jgi:bla regulator protein blaR1